MSRDWRDDRIAELEQLLKAALERIAAQEARIAELEEKLRVSSRNSGKPPSSDSPGQQAERKKKAARITRPKKGRKPGGQPGHQKFSRPLVPAGEVARHHDCVPEQCARCQARLSGEDPEPRLHQVFHLPEVRPWVEQFALHRRRCECGHVTCGKLPDGVPSGAFGPSVVATVTLLMGVCRLGKRKVQQLMSDLFGLDMSLGAVIGCQELGSEAVAAPVDDAKDFVRTARAGVRHSDETSWREGPKRLKVWLWTAVTDTVTVFSIQRERSAQAATDLLGTSEAPLVSDRYSSYGFWALWARQVCWAHLIRDFVAIAERGTESKRLGDDLLDEARRLFGWYHRVRDGTLKRSTFQIYAREVRKRVRHLLQQGQTCAQKKTARTCAQILKVEPALWLFLEREDVPPTNNAAEQALRHAVLWRKLSGGTHSELGSRFVERILTVVATLRRQERHVLTFLKAACQAHLAGEQSPSLLERSPSEPQLAHAA